MDTMTLGTDRSEQPRLTKWEWERAVLASDLRPVVRQLLLTLGVYMDGAGANCYPSADVIAAGMGVKRGTVFDLLKEATKAGWLERASKGGRGAFGLGGTGKTNLYLPRRPHHATVGVHPTVAEAVEVPAPGATVSGHGDQPSDGHGDQPSGGHGDQPSVDTRRNQTKDQTKDQTKNQTKDQTKNQEEGAVLLDREDWTESLWCFLLLRQTAGLDLPAGEDSDEAACLMLTAARALGCPDEALQKHRRVWLGLHRQVVEALAAGADVEWLVHAISGEEPPVKVRCWPAFLKTRLDVASVEAKRAATA